jgi:hypothetical protein
VNSWVGLLRRGGKRTLHYLEDFISGECRALSTSPRWNFAAIFIMMPWILSSQLVRADQQSNLPTRGRGDQGEGSRGPTASARILIGLRGEHRAPVIAEPNVLLPLDYNHLSEGRGCAN